MLKLFLLATLATLSPTQLVEPDIGFTSDSVYTKDTIVEITPIEREDTLETGIVDVQFTFNHEVGYEIFDDAETEYIDGIKINDTWLPKSLIYEGFDCTVENKILIKTVYSDDFAGMMMAAKAGDFSALLANPLTILQMGYYILAALSLIITGFGIVKLKGKKVKSADEIAKKVESAASVTLNGISNSATNIYREIELFTNLQTIDVTSVTDCIEESFENMVHELMPDCEIIR